MTIAIDNSPFTIFLNRCKSIFKSTYCYSLNNRIYIYIINNCPHFTIFIDNL